MSLSGAISALQGADQQLQASIAALQPPPPAAPPLPTGQISPAANIVGNTIVVTPLGMNLGPDRVPLPQPTMTAVKNGDWSDPTVWSGGVVPGASDNPFVPQGISLTIASGTWQHAIIDGTLTPLDNCRISCVTLMQLRGSLNIGTSAQPANNVVIMFADVPCNTAVDPGQYLNGLVNVSGNMVLYGQPKTPWVYAPATVPGATSISVTQAGWQVGDQLVFSDTAQTLQTYSVTFAPHCETVTITGISGNVVQFSPPLQYAHRACSTDLTLLPPVLNLTRSITFTSANPNGARGHAIFLHDANVTMSGVRFDNLGRTTGKVVTNSATWDSSGNVTHVGTNQIGRYSCHCHHTCSSVSITNCSITNGVKWGLVVHDVLDSTFSQNVIYNFAGAGVMTETSHELRNAFDGNCVCKVANAGRYDSQGGVVFSADGAQQLDVGFNGSGFWFRGGNNHVQNNVAVNCEFAGFEYDGYANNPDAPGGLQWIEPTTECNVLANVPSTGFGNCDNNTAIACQFGLWFVWPQGEGQLLADVPMPVNNPVAWHCYACGVFPYHECNLQLVNPVIRSDPSVAEGNYQGDNDPAARTTLGINCSQASYQNCGITVTGGTIVGCNYGILGPQSLFDGKTARPASFSGIAMANWCNFMLLPNTDGYERDITISNCTFSPSGMIKPLSAISPKTETDYYMAWIGSTVSWLTPSKITVVNGQTSQQLYFPQQVPGFVIPSTPAGIVPTPASVIGQTNQQLVAAGLPPVCGVMAPADAVVNPPRVIGLLK